MPRKRKDDTGHVKKRVRSFRTRERKQRRDTAAVATDDLTWVTKSKLKMTALKILNDHGERPYWVSIPKDGAEPVAGFFPCSSFVADGRVYYGFLLREHRDAVFERWDHARKELTSGNRPLTRG